MEGNNADKSRLPTFKAPRDLTLANKISAGAIRSRKNFIPNIPPRRDRSSSSGSSTSSTNSQSPSPSSRKFSNTRKDQNQSRGRRSKPELIQSDSIFSTGVGDGERSKKFSVKPSVGFSSGGISRGRGGGEAGVSRRATAVVATENNKTGRYTLSDGLKSEGIVKGQGVELTEEERRHVSEELAEQHVRHHERIGNGNFIEDLEEAGDVPKSLEPIELPLSDYLKDYIERLSSVPVSIPFKTEEFDLGVKSESHHATDAIFLNPLTFAHTLITAPTEGTIIFLQMPDQLPVLHQTTTESVSVKEAKLSSDIGVFPEGYIGKIQILASGKSRLVLGENTFEIESAKQVAFRQELAAIDLENKKMTTLGPVKQKFVCTPELDLLFRQALL